MWSVYSCREGDSSVHPTGLRSAPASIPGIKVAPSLILHENISRNLSIMENICRLPSRNRPRILCFFFAGFLMMPGHLLSPPSPHGSQMGGKAGEEGKEASPGWDLFSRGIKWLFRGIKLLSIGITPMGGLELTEISDLGKEKQNWGFNSKLELCWEGSGSKISSDGIRIFQGLLCHGCAQSWSSLGTELRAALAGGCQH